MSSILIPPILIPLKDEETLPEGKSQSNDCPDFLPVPPFLNVTLVNFLFSGSLALSEFIPLAWIIESTLGMSFLTLISLPIKGPTSDKNLIR